MNRPRERSPGGIYALIVEVCGKTQVGHLGPLAFDGIYVYVGSAMGPGGLAARIRRHRRVTLGEVASRHWHIDYLLAISNRLTVLGAETADRHHECALAAEIGARASGLVAGFGASDCRCRSHLGRMPADDESIVRSAFTALGLECHYLN